MDRCSGLAEKRIDASALEYAAKRPEVDRSPGSREVDVAMRVIASTLCLLLFATPSMVLAADPAPPPAAPPTSAEEAPKTQQIRAVERGFFLETDAGVSLVVNKFNFNDAQGKQYSLSSGLSVLAGAFAGVDILPILSFSIGAYAMGTSINRDQTINAAQGDLLFVIPSAQLQFALITTERNFLFVRGGAGFAFGLPAQINGVDFGGNGPAFNGMVGFERYTKLRHFSIGVLAGAMVVTKPSVGIGVSVTPTVKYTF
jgi:hypothetical protein